MNSIIQKARDFLAGLAAQPWFPRRKVIAGLIVTYLTQFISTKLHFDLSTQLQVVLDGGVGALVAYLIPERPAATLHALTQDLMSNRTALVPGPGGVPLLASPPPVPVQEAPADPNPPPAS